MRFSVWRWVSSGRSQSCAGGGWILEKAAFQRRGRAKSPFSPCPVPASWHDCTRLKYFDLVILQYPQMTRSRYYCLMQSRFHKASVL
jgi:hypothetical protein